MAGDIARVQNASLHLNGGESTPVDSPAWFAWLETAVAFSFSDPAGSFTARHESVGQGRGSRYWKAYRRRDGKLRRVYLGRSADLTLERLTAAALALARTESDCAETADMQPCSETPQRDISTGRGGALRVPVERLEVGRDGGTPRERLRVGLGARQPIVAARAAADATSLAQLPRYLTSFVGRERDIAQITQLLTWTRLLMLTGPGGVGKTRLALQVADALRTRFASGALFVSLASLADPALVPAAIAQAVGVKETAGRSIADSLVAMLRDRELLLVLDNFEHVADAAPSIANLLGACSRLTVIVTSRNVLRLSGEHEFPVAPLALPNRRETPTTQRLASYEAVHLFCARARAARHDFVLTDQNGQAVAELCQRLDGLPLAIELAAVRLHTLTLSALVARLERPLPLLTVGPRDAPARQQTLRATIAWSHDLLEPAEQVLFRRLAVLRGATFDAIQAICFPAGAGSGSASIALSAIPADALESITSLVEKNLLVEGELPDGQPWFTMLETIREFAFERLAASGEADAVFRRHALYYLKLVEVAEQEWLVPHPEAWFDRLKKEHDNLRRAFDWCVERGYAEPSFRMTAVLWWFWAMLGHLAEGRERLNRLLARFPAKGAPDKLLAWRAQGLRSAGMLASIQGDYAVARAFQEEGLTLRRQLGDPAGIFNALEGVGMVASQQGDHVAARVALEEALAIAAQLGEPTIYASTLQNLGTIVHAQGELAIARELLEACVERRRAINDPLVPHRLSWTLLSLAAVLHDLGEDDGARALLLEAIDRYEPRGDQRLQALAMATLASIDLAQGDDTAAERSLRASLAIQQELENTAGITDILERYAELAVARGDAARAMRLAGAAAALRDTIGVRLTPAGQVQLDRTLEPARRALGALASDNAWNAGRALSPEEAIAETLALSTLTESPNAGRAKTAKATLTHREREVAGLIARGQTNRQIAAMLVITEGTVANHVVHILAKLGYNARSQIAVWAANNGLLAAHGRD
jgi:predicted ATPase/DNA-binding CsgD family transcriptional regulator